MTAFTNGTTWSQRRLRPYRFHYLNIVKEEKIEDPSPNSGSSGEDKGCQKVAKEIVKNSNLLDIIWQAYRLDVSSKEAVLIQLVASGELSCWKVCKFLSL